VKSLSARSRVSIPIFWTVALLSALNSCSKSEPVKREATPLDLSTVGTITGSVAFSGNAPESRAIQLSGFAECLALHTQPLYADDALVKNGKLQNVLVYVKEGLGDRVFAAPDTPLVVDQQGCVFEPHVAAAQVGQPVRFMNTDPLAHNVHGVPKKASAWNFNLGVKGASRTITIDQAENVIPLKCDIHPWMTAYLGVFDHPYFAVTGPDGRFELRNLPPGQYVVEAWHERFGTRTANVTVGPKETQEISFSFAG